MAEPVASTSADRLLDRLLAVEEARPMLDRAAAEAAVRRSLDLAQIGPVEFRWIDDFEQELLAPRPTQPHHATRGDRVDIRHRRLQAGGRNMSQLPLFKLATQPKPVPLGPNQRAVLRRLERCGKVRVREAGRIVYINRGHRDPGRVPADWLESAGLRVLISLRRHGLVRHRNGIWTIRPATSRRS